MSSADAGPPNPLDAPYLEALITESLALAGLGQLEAPVIAQLGGAQRLVIQNIIDLSPLWTVLTGELAQDPTQAATALLFMVFYLDQLIQTRDATKEGPAFSLSLSQEARLAVEAQLGTQPDIDSKLAGLRDAINRRLGGGAPGPAAPPAPAPLDAPHLQAAALEALRYTGLGQHEGAMVSRWNTNHRLLKGHIIDTAAIWGPLTGDLKAPPEQVAQAILLLTLYLERRTNMVAGEFSLAVPAEVKEVIEGQIAAQPELEAKLNQLTPAVANRLSKTAMALITGRGAAVSGKNATVGGPPSASGARAADEKEKKRQQRTRELVRAAAAVVVIVGIIAYWGFFFYRQYAEAEAARLPMDELSAVYPAIKGGHIANDTAILLMMDDGYAKMDPLRQMELGSKLLQAIGRPHVKKLFIVSGAKQFRVEKTTRSVRVDVFPRPRNPEPKPEGVPKTAEPKTH